MGGTIKRIEGGAGLAVEGAEGPAEDGADVVAGVVATGIAGATTGAGRTGVRLFLGSSGSVGSREVEPVSLSTGITQGDASSFEMCGGRWGVVEVVVLTGIPTGGRCAMSSRTDLLEAGL